MRDPLVPSALTPLSPFSTASQLISDSRIINKTFARKGGRDSSLPAPPLSYKSIKYSFKIKYKEQKGPALGATCSPQENESTHPSRTCLGDGGPFPAPPRGEKGGQARPRAPGPRARAARPPRTEADREGLGPPVPGFGPAEALRAAAAPELRGERRLQSRRSKGKSANPVRELGPAGAERRWGRPRALPPEPAGGGRSPGPGQLHPTHEQPPARVRRTFPAGRPRAPPPELACVCVQASERPRPARPGRRPDPGFCPPACHAAERGPRPGEERRGPLPFPQPVSGPNTDCRRPHPGPAQERRAGWGRTRDGAASCRRKSLEAAEAPREARSPVRGGPGRWVRPAPGTPWHPPIPNLRPARPAGGSGSALPGRGRPARPAGPAAITPDTRRPP